MKLRVLFAYCIFFCILWTLSYFAYYAYHWHIILHIILHIKLHIMHIVHSSYYAYWTYLFACCMRTPLAMPQGNTYYAYLWHIMHTIYCHILHIGSMISCAFSAYLWTYCFNTFRIMHIMHIVFILVIFYIYCIFYVQDSFQCHSLFISNIVWPPIQGPSCSLITAYIHHHCSGFCHKKLQESPLILFAVIPFSPNRDCFRCGKRKRFTQR